MWMLRIFWLEAVAVPVYFLFQLAQLPPGTAYRGLNLTVWTAVLVAAIGGLAWTKLRRRRAGAESG